MRVLHFCESFSPLSTTFIYDLIVELERQGIDNHVLALDRENADTRPFPKVTVVSRAEKYNPGRILCRIWHGRGTGSALEAAWRIERRRIQRVLKRVRPDLVHAHFGPMGVLIAPVARGLGVKCITSFHAYDVTTVPKQQFWKEQYRSLWSQGAAFTGVSRHICGLLEALGAGREKIVRISNGVDLSKFPFNPPGKRFDGKNVECLFVGRLVEKKAPLLVLRAFESARKALGRKADLRLHIVGDGPLMRKLREERQALGLDHCVDIHGALSHQEVRAMMQQAHLYLQHSVTAPDGDQEGLPVGLIEASATGLPIVSTRHDGIPEVVLDGKAGFLVEEHDVEGMAEKLACLAASSSLWDQMGRTAREHVERHMRLDVQAGTWGDLYARVCEGKRSITGVL
jgi:glycosyltransferase involved in cell wall biosynthesis